MRCYTVYRRCVLWLLLSVIPGPVLGEEPANWSGVWSTGWQSTEAGGTGATLYLRQVGDTVTGEYPLYQGTIEGQVNGQVLSGDWRQPASEGTFIFTLAPDGQSFVGRFGNGEWWTGGRRRAGVQSPHPITDLSSPQQTLRAFLLTLNWARDNRDFDILASVLATVDDRHLGNDPTPGRRIAYMRSLFHVLDQLTFRLWSIPEPTDSDRLTVTLSPAGSEETFPLTFRYNRLGDGSAGWQILPPPPEALQEAVGRLLAQRGHEQRDPRRHLELRNPRDAMRTFLEQLRRWDSGGSEHVLRALDLSGVSEVSLEAEGRMFALYLREVLDRIGWVIWQEIPNDPASRVPYVHFRHPQGNIEIAPTETEDGVIWRFTPATLDSLRALYGAMEDMPRPEFLVGAGGSTFFLLRNWVRGIDRDLLRPVGELELWQWIALTGIILLGTLLGWLISWVVFRLARWLWKSADPLRWRLRFFWPLRLALITGLWLLGVGLVGLPEFTLNLFQTLTHSLLIVALGWLTYYLVDALGLLYYERSTARVGYRYEILRSLLVGAIKIGVLIGTLLLLAEVLEIPYEGVIAGLGISGLALALAARTTVENFIGGLTLFADKPLEVGDFCQFGGKVGTVEEIGLRSTRIRSLDRTVISIPNAEFVNLQLENFGRRDRILLSCVLQLRYETTPDQLRHVLARVRQLLVGHPRVLEVPARVRFAGFGAHSLDLEIFAYVDSSDWGEFLAIREDLFLRMIDLVEESGTGFAFPSQTLYMARDGGLDAERRQAAEQAVAQWRAGNRLPFPDMDSEGIEAWRSSLDYPPKGSFGNPREEAGPAPERERQPVPGD